MADFRGVIQIGDEPLVSGSSSADLCQDARIPRQTLGFYGLHMSSTLFIDQDFFLE